VLGREDGCCVAEEIGTVLAEEVAFDTASDAVDVAYWQRVQMKGCLRSARDRRRILGGIVTGDRGDATRSRCAESSERWCCFMDPSRFLEDRRRKLLGATAATRSPLN